MYDVALSALEEGLHKNVIKCMFMQFCGIEVCVTQDLLPDFKVACESSLELTRFVHNFSKSKVNLDILPQSKYVRNGEGKLYMYILEWTPVTKF